ncbi:MAG: ATP-dependent helicase HrpB [Bdellovibrionaceae bacterium]|nr:ATP-dependent helicase HrpB [Pseudobdellovibrionaceae bacterium]
MSLRPLPIDAHLPDILAALKSHGNLVLVASPGAGKTTRVPTAILGSQLLSSKAPGILMLEPRRLAARAAAARMAAESGVTLGEDIGYQVRFDNRTSARTRLCVMTEGLLARRLARDPNLDGIGCVILDEFHERSWHTDLGLGLLRELKELARPDLKIIVMSATMKATQVAEFLGQAPIIDVKAEAHPIQIHHERDPQLLVTGPDWCARVSRAIADCLNGQRESRGDILVFLPGAREIQNVANQIESLAQAHQTDVRILHGNLRLEDQDLAIRPSPRRKVVLATNIAETSLTIDGVATVIDSGLARVARLDATGFPRLELSRISRFSAIQRMGRAGRQGPGVCHRLWTKLDEASMPESEQPEIHRIELAEAVLLLIHLGVGDPKHFSWFEAPGDTAIQAALTLLTRLQALDPLDHGSPRLTPLGERLLHWPLHPRLARLMEAARAKREWVANAALLCSLISEREIISDPAQLRGASDLESDLLLRLDALQGHVPANLDRSATAQVRRAAEQIERMAHSRRDPPLKNSVVSTDSPERELLLLAFPDRVARRRRKGEPEARLVGGKGIRLSRKSCVERSELFVVIDAAALKTEGGGALGAKAEMTATLASGIDRSWLRVHFPHHVRELREPVFNKTSGRVLLHIYEAYEDLPLEDPRTTDAEPEEVARLLPGLVTEQWPEFLKRNEAAARWLDRFDFLRAACPEWPWPPWNPRDPFDKRTQDLIAALCTGEKTVPAILSKDPSWHFENTLGPELSARLHQHAPETATVPTGNRMRIHYPPDRAPYLEVRIQEVFGWHQSPLVADGHVRIVLHLLGPNYRPVQVTSDLSSFWANGYKDVRKELRTRYPKHAWPEDPLSAPPQAKGPRRNT